MTPSPKPLRRQLGLTAAELMVAMTIGALVTLLAVSLLLVSNASAVAQADAAGVDDAGRYALGTIERAVRQAGFVDLADASAAATYSTAPPAVVGLDAASLSSSTSAVGSPRPAVANGSDILALRFAGSGGGAGDGSAITCAGFAVGAGQQGWSIFYVGTSAAGDTELRCKYKGAAGWNADAVIGGVDSFQVLYGIDTDTAPDGVANKFVSAGQIKLLDDALPVAGDTELEQAAERMRRSAWRRVASVRVALVVHGAHNSVTATGRDVWHLFGDAYSAASDGKDEGTQLAGTAFAPRLQQRERRMFTTTVMLRNAQR